MRRYVFLIFFCVVAIGADVSELRRLDDTGRYFGLSKELRVDSSRTANSDYYAGTLASRFGRESDGISRLKKWLSSDTAKDASRTMRRRAYEEIASAHLRAGNYGDAAAALEEALRLAGARSRERAGLENSRVLADALRGVAPQAIQFDTEAIPVRAIRNRGGTWDVPVEVNGSPATWLFDTGANLSVIAESEAARLGLSVRETNANVKGSTGKRNAIRLATADRLRLGSARLQNVVLIVLPDAALQFPEIGFAIKGFIGLPVIRALGCVGISAEGALRMGRAACIGGETPNLFFEDLGLIVEASIGERPLQWLLDSGANQTDLYPSSRPALGGTPLRKETESSGGAGRVVRRTVETVAELSLGLGGRSIVLRGISMLAKQPPSRCRDGLIGLDAFGKGFQLDFQAMRFRVD